MALPLIGLTTSRIKNKHGTPLSSVAEAYVRSVAQAGGVPVPIPLGLSDEALETLLAQLAGIVFTGGGDVHPRYYTPSADHLVDAVDEERDRVEFFLLHRTLEQHMPFLGICRGMQMVNVALGGTLYADLQAHMPGAAKHDFYPAQPRDYLAHSVQIASGTHLEELLGQAQTAVNSMHHQGVRSLAPALVASACIARTEG